MGENEQGEAAAAANATNLLEIAQDALLTNIQKCQVLSGELDKWNKHVKENTGKGLALLKRPAKAGAKAFTTLETLTAEVYELQERWKEVNTVPENELDELSEEDPTYNLATGRLTQLIGGWEKCLSTARTCFYGYKKQDELDAAELGLEFLGGTFEDALNETFTALDELNVSKNKSEEPPKAGEKPKEKSKTEVTVVRVVTLPVHSSSPDQSNNDILNVSPILRPGDKVHNNSSGGSSVMTPEVLWNRISTFQSLVEARLAKLSSKSGEDNPSKSTEEGLRELKADLKSEKEVLKLLDNIDEHADNPDEDFNDFRDWRLLQLGTVESLLDMVQDKREESRDHLHRAQQRGPTTVMFEKMKLPIFTGKSLDYVDFKVKWMDQVHTAGYNELQELANLKD